LIVTGGVVSIMDIPGSSSTGGGDPGCEERDEQGEQSGEPPGEEQVDDEEDAHPASASAPDSSDALLQLRRGRWCLGAGTAKPTERDAGSIRALLSGRFGRRVGEGKGERGGEVVGGGDAKTKVRLVVVCIL
jgi:hypothetical protein